MIQVYITSWAWVNPDWALPIATFNYPPTISCLKCLKVIIKSRIESIPIVVASVVAAAVADAAIATG